MRVRPDLRASAAGRIGRVGTGSIVIAVSLFALIAGRVGEYSMALAAVRPVLLVLAVGALFTFINFRRLGGARVLQDRIFLLGISYYLWILVTIPFALWPGHAFQAVRFIPIGLFLMFAMAFVPGDRKHLDRLLTACVAATTVGALFAMRSGNLTAGRLSTGGMLDPNDLASLLAAVLPFSIVRYITPGRLWLRLAALGAALIMVLTLLQTGSRGGMVAMLMGILIVAARWNPRRVVAFAATAVLVVSIVWSQTPLELRERFGTLTSLEEDYNMTDDFGRLATWTRGIGYFVDNPVVGVGYDNFGVAEGERIRALNITGPWLTAHNAYIQAFAELGAPGGLIFFFMVGIAVRRGAILWRERHPEYLASIGAFATGAFFLSHAYSYTLFGLFGIIILASKVFRLGRPAPSRVPRLRGATIGGRAFRANRPVPVAPAISNGVPVGDSQVSRVSP